MAINNVKDIQSLLVDIEDWMNNPKFQPQEQNKWFFGEGLSYYTQLCEVVKVLTYLQENFKIVIANEKSLEQGYNEVKDLPSQFTVLSNKVDDLTNTVSDLPTRVQELETKVTKLINDVSSQLTRIETLEGNVNTNTQSISSINTEVDKIKVKNSDQDVKIEKLQSDVVSINAKDISQDSEIASIKSKNQEQDTLIDKNTSGITELKNANYLKELVLQNSATISFTGGIKENGIQTYTGQVIGSIPANLTENLAFSNNNVTPIVYSISSNDIIEQEKYIASAILTHSINNGISNNSTIPVSKFNNNHFEKNTANIISIKNSVLEPYETKTNASATYETKANASATYVSKTDAVGYDDILTNANASTTYETKTNASTTYETKTNASSTYVSKTDAVGYDDILTNANASTIYETKQHASDTYINRSSIIDIIYPVGSIYMSVNNTEPSTLFGGTWEKIKDRFLLGSGDTYTNGNSGGEAQHTLTVEEMPAHRHSQRLEYTNATNWGIPDSTASDPSSNILIDNGDNTGITGNSQPHNNMPPYLVVNIWQRVS